METSWKPTLVLMAVFFAPVLLAVFFMPLLLIPVAAAWWLLGRWSSKRDKVGQAFFQEVEKRIPRVKLRPLPPRDPPTLWQTTQSWAAWLSRVLKSAWAIMRLPKEKMDSFLNSYDIFSVDWQRDEEAVRRKFGDNYKEVMRQKIVDYYTVLRHLCSMGGLEKFYIPPALDLSASCFQNQVLYEQLMARALNVGPGSRVLDVGCGQGRIACHVAALTGATLMGVNVDETQLASARMYAASPASALHPKTPLPTFQYGDINSVPFKFPDGKRIPDGHFDGIYHVQVFSYARCLPELFQELYRLLKPGGMFVCLDWVAYPEYKPDDARHQHLLTKIKPLIGAVGTPTVQEYTEGLEQAGFKVQYAEDPSVTPKGQGHQAPLLRKITSTFEHLSWVVTGMTKTGLLPDAMVKVYELFHGDVDAFIEADEKGIFTSSFFIAAQKPLA